MAVDLTCSAYPDDLYSLYLVTDSTPAILGDKSLVDVVDKAIQGGVTIVQYRDKTSSTGVLVETARALHQVCRKHNVPLLINDRIDVALAVGCEGVHVGQDDMSVPDARRLLGPNKIIGCTVASMKEAVTAVNDGADYLGIGTVYSTNTKKDTKSILGINGVREILKYLETRENETCRDIKTVVIGGINASNLQLVKHQLLTPSPHYVSHDGNRHEPKTIDGVALVSAIVAAPDSKAAAAHLKELWATPAPWVHEIAQDFASESEDSDDIETVKKLTKDLAGYVHESKPVSHNMTNAVVTNFAANVALAMGASPIMSSHGPEAADLAKLGGGLVINMGTATPTSLENQRMAIRAYNAAGAPVVLDPVGAGATAHRKEALAYLMASGYFDVIKGNEAEILEVAKVSGLRLSSKFQQTQQRGVDSGASIFTDNAAKAYVVSRLAARERNIVLMTGAIDIVSDGERTYEIENGNELLGQITGSGCTLGTAISAYVAAGRASSKVPMIYAVIAAMLHFELAAERAVSQQTFIGPGKFAAAFIDQLAGISHDVKRDAWYWLKGADINKITSIADAKLLAENGSQYL